jgi:hypothetical protein
MRFEFSDRYLVYNKQTMHGEGKFLTGIMYNADKYNRFKEMAICGLLLQVGQV